MSDNMTPRSTEQIFFASLLASDVKALDGVLTDDFLLVDAMRGTEVDRKKLCSALGSRQIRFEEITPEDCRVRLYGTTAVINGRTHMRGRLGDQHFSVHSRYTHVFRQQEDQWRLVSAQGTPISPDDPVCTLQTIV
jgi:ketosteroid isomerase-like protein